MTNTIIKNKKALFDFNVEDQIEAGISLKGWEVKSLRSNRGNIKESYALVKNNEVFIIGSHISPMPNVRANENTDPTRTRKLLLKAKEISKKNIVCTLFKQPLSNNSVLCGIFSENGEILDLFENADSSAFFIIFNVSLL